MPSVSDVIVHCQKQIKKDPPGEKLLHYLARLDRLRVTVQDLVDTGIGRTINQLSRHEGDVGKRAAELVKKWKDMVSEQEQSEEEDESEDSQSGSSEEEEDGMEIVEDEGGQGHGQEEEGEDEGTEVVMMNGHDNGNEEEDEEFGESQRNQEQLHYPVEDVKVKIEKSYGEVEDEEEEDEGSYVAKVEEYQPEEKLDRGHREDGSRHHHKSSKHKEKSKKRDKEKEKEVEYHSSSSSGKHKHKDKDRERERERELKDKKKDKEKDKHNSSSSSSHKKKHKEKDRDREREKEKKSSGESHSSSSNRSRDKDKEHKHKHKEESSSSREKRKRESSPSPDGKKKIIKLDEPDSSSDSKKREHDRTPKKKASIHIDEEINSGSGVNFEELLGCLDKNLTKTKDKSKKHGSSSSSSKAGPNDEVTKLVRRHEASKSHDKRKNPDSIIPNSYNISPNYKPQPIVRIPPPPPKPVASLQILEHCDPGNYWEDSHLLYNDAKDPNPEDTLSSMMSSRNQRTKVFSGRSVAYKGGVPKLFDLSMQVIQENIGELGYTGGVPYEILKPALERATAQQLLQIEYFNEYLIGSTDELWKFHCSREFRGLHPDEYESWRELYERCIQERDQKFDIIRKKMLKKVEVAEPARKAKLAYVEPIGGPRFNRQKANTIKNGMKTLKFKEEKGSKKAVGTTASAGFNNPTDKTKLVEEHAVLINPESRAGHAPARVSREESVARVKPRKAPLMAKTMKFIKTLKRR